LRAAWEKGDQSNAARADLCALVETAVEAVYGRRDWHLPRPKRPMLLPPTAVNDGRGRGWNRLSAPLRGVAARPGVWYCDVHS
jgi:hypothetical protein